MTELRNIIGQKELPNIDKYNPQYETTALEIVEFYGGELRGKCLQLSLEDKHIQLPKERIIVLRDELIEWLDNF